MMLIYSLEAAVCIPRHGFHLPPLERDLAPPPPIPHS